MGTVESGEPKMKDTTTTLDEMVTDVADLATKLERLAAKLRADAACQEDRKTAYRAEVVAAHARLLLTDIT